jgi:hypothetical protein
MNTILSWSSIWQKWTPFKNMFVLYLFSPYY